MCSTSSSLHYKRVRTVYAYVIAEPTSVVLSFTHMTQYVRLSYKTFNRSVDSLNKVLLWRYCSTMHDTLHTTPQKIVERCQILWSGTGPHLPIHRFGCNVEVTPRISIKVRGWLKGCIPAELGHQNESEQIVTPVRSQTSTLYLTQTVRFRTGVPFWTLLSLPSCTTY